MRFEIVHNVGSGLPADLAKAYEEVDIWPDGRPPFPRGLDPKMAAAKVWVRVLAIGRSGKIRPLAMRYGWEGSNLMLSVDGPQAEFKDRVKRRCLVPTYCIPAIHRPSHDLWHFYPQGKLEVWLAACWQLREGRLEFALWEGPCEYPRAVVTSRSVVAMTAQEGFQFLQGTRSLEAGSTIILRPVLSMRGGDPMPRGKGRH